MKLSEIANPNEPIKKFLEFLGTDLKFELSDDEGISYSCQGYGIPHTDETREIKTLFRISNTGKISIPAKYDDFTILTAGRRGDWAFPLELFDEAHLSNTIYHFSIIAHRGFMKFNSFEQLPNVNNFLFSGDCELRSFVGVEKLTHLKHIQYAGYQDIHAGLLRLLKAPALVGIDVPINTENKDLQTATKIVSSHLANGRSVPECQQELIEEGLQKYAKL